MKLDSLSESEGQLLLRMGNANVNAIWEAGANDQKGWEKPSGTAGRQAKEEWIKSKYLWRGFLQYSDEDGKTHIDREEKFSQEG